DIAYRYYRNILPIKYNERAEILKAEPYVYSQTICSNDSINPGEAANSWLTGTASWMFVAATQYILGIKPEPEGLRIEPRIPYEWQGYRMKRVFRGCEYDIEVKRTGKKAFFLDNRLISGNLVKPAGKKFASVRVEL
ncbi:MAG TPA: glycosyl transferase, partial [Candidatus Goldiibacteriota bacterium]|nr:glycosyl transferase [Candidatus Goldiibacteriota bacterium]